MYRYEVPVDDASHVFYLSSPPMAAATTVPGFVSYVVEFWAEHEDHATATHHVYQVFGTGHELPPNARWAATCPRTDSGLVFHLYELLGNEQ
jgi:hypothetical protein